MTNQNLWGVKSDFYGHDRNKHNGNQKRCKVDWDSFGHQLIPNFSWMDQKNLVFAVLVVVVIVVVVAAVCRLRCRHRHPRHCRCRLCRSHCCYWRLQSIKLGQQRLWKQLRLRHYIKESIFWKLSSRKKSSPKIVKPLSKKVFYLSCKKKQKDIKEQN